MKKDYKNLDLKKQPRRVPEALANIYAFMGISGWMMCIYLIDKLS